MPSFRRLLHPFALLTTVGALALSGCKADLEAENKAERESNARKVTADSTANATDPIVDEAFQFRLSPPDAGWKMLGARDAASINPDAIAGAIGGNGAAFGIVIAERLPGTTLEQAVALVVQNAPPGVEVESEEDIEFQGTKARRRVFTAKVEGQAFRYVATIFIHQEHLYQLQSWSLVSKPVAPLVSFHDAFVLLDGEVRGRTVDRAPTLEADGVGWQIRAGRYASALSGLALRVSPGWRFVVGAELERLGSDAEIVCMHDETNIYVALTVERVSADRLDALATLSRDSFPVGERVGEPVTKQVAGQAVAFRRYLDAPLEYLHGVYVGPDAITALAIWYPSGSATEAEALVDALLPGFEAIAPAERTELHSQLLRAPSDERRFATDRSYRAGEFLDFSNDLRWTKPPGFWHVDGFDKALDHSAETVLLARESEFGVYVAVEALDAGTNSAEDIVGWLSEGHEVSRHETIERDGLSVVQITSADTSKSPAIQYAMEVTRRGARMIATVAWSAGDSPEARAAMTDAIAGLAYTGPLERTRYVGRHFTDLRFGFEFDVPAGIEGDPAITDLGLGQLAVWTQGNKALIAMVLSNAATTDDEQWISSFFEQILRDQVGANQGLGTPERSETQLGTHSARQLRWAQNGEVLVGQIVVRDTVVYCILSANLSDAQTQAVRQSWALLERG